MKPTPKKLREQIREEHQSSRMYRKEGHPEIAKQETHHAKILTRQLKRLEKAKK